jgi:hypothetical protein
MNTLHHLGAEKPTTTCDWFSKNECT